MIGSQKDLAAKLGISQMTVSRVLRGEDGVSPRLRTQIVALAQEAGFLVPEFRQRGKNARTQVVCAMVSVTHPADRSDFQTRLLQGILNGGRELGCEVMNFPEKWRGQWPLLVNRRQVDGVVHVFGGDPASRPPRTCPIPHVSVFCPIDEVSDWITVNDADASRAIGEYLVRMGHRRVAFVGPTSSLAQERLMGLTFGLQQGGGRLEPANIHMAKHASRDSVVSQLDTLIPPGTTPANLRRRFTVIAFYNDDMALTGIAHLRSRGFRVPDDISVTGFDGTTTAIGRDFQLMTAAMPLENIGVEAMRMLYWRLDYPTSPVRRLMLTAPLVEGDTVRPA